MKRPIVKSIAIALLTTTVSLSIGLLGNWNSNQSKFLLKILFFIISIIIYFVVLGYYAANEVNDRKANETKDKQINIYQDVLTNIISICHNTSTEINTSIHIVNKTKKIDLNIWSFNKACRLFCDLIYNSICILGDCKEYEVSYVRLKENNNSKNIVYMNAYANKNKIKPSNFNIPRCFDDIDEDKFYYDLKLFKTNRNDIDVIVGRENIKKFFGYRSNKKRDNSKYNQYIGIPIFCNDEKMIGLLQVVSLNNASFGLSEEEVKEIANKYLNPYANMFLILHKMEKALLAGTNENQKNINND